MPSRFRMPTPCSPVTVPPSAIAASRNSSNAAWAASRAAASPGGVIRHGCRFPPPAVRDGGVPPAVPGRDRADLLQHRGHLGPGYADVLGEHRTEPLERGV